MSAADVGVNEQEHPASPVPPPLPSEGVAVVLPVVPHVRGRRPWVAIIGACWLVLVVVGMLLVSFFDAVPGAGTPVGPPRGGPDGTLAGLLGYDPIGRSTFSRLLYGARVSLLVGVAAGLIGFTVGTFLGLLAGYLRGPVDAVISFLADGLLAFPPLVLLLSLASVLEPSLRTLVIALAILTVPTFTRLSRANTMRWSSREFVMAATNMGAGSGRIMVREILPNLVPSVAAYLPIVVAALIVAEGSLSFLGLGIPPPTPSWGGMINEGHEYMRSEPILITVPSLAIFLTVLSLNLVGDQLRSRFGQKGR